MAIPPSSDHHLSEADLGAGLRQRIRAPVGDAGQVHAIDRRSFRDAALSLADEIGRGLPTDTEIECARGLISRLGEDKRLVAFFTSGATSLASQAIAQFAGWNIPGVGEGDQRFRPRTRLYDTVDPDTIGQVRETLDYDRTSFLFVDDEPAEPVRAWSEALLPAVATRADAGERVAYVSADTGTTEHAALDAVERMGGQTLSLGNAHGLSCAPLLVGLARGLDLAAVRRGAETALDIIRETCRAAEPMSPAVLWPAMIFQALSDTPNSTARLELYAGSDRLARFSAWACGTWLTQAPASIAVSSSSQAVSGLAATQIGHTRSSGVDHARFAEFHVASALSSDRDPQVFRDLIRRMEQGACDSGAKVRTLSMTGYTAEAYGALALRTIWESQMVAALGDTA